MLRLKELRLERGIKQKTVANALNIPQSTYSDWERGINEPNYNFLIKIAKLYNISVDYLIGLENDEGYIINNTLSETENLLIEKCRRLNIQEQSNLIEYANFLIYRKSEISKILNHNELEISDIKEMIKNSKSIK